MQTLSSLKSTCYWTKVARNHFLRQTHSSEAQDSWIKRISDTPRFLKLLGPRFRRLLWKWLSPAQPASLPFFAKSVCMALDLLSQKCFWDRSVHKGTVKCVSLPSGSVDFCTSGHTQLIVPINVSQRTPGLLQEPALPWNRKLYLHCLGAWCSSIKGKRVL